MKHQTNLLILKKIKENNRVGQVNKDIKHFIIDVVFIIILLLLISNLMADVWK